MANDDFSELPRRADSKSSISFFADFRVRFTSGPGRPVLEACVWHVARIPLGFVRQSSYCLACHTIHGAKVKKVSVLEPLRTAPRDHQPPTANRPEHQPPPTANRQPPTAPTPTANRLPPTFEVEKVLCPGSGERPGERSFLLALRRSFAFPRKDSPCQRGGAGPGGGGTARGAMRGARAFG